ALWFNIKNEEVQFSVKEAWKVLRVDGPEVLYGAFLGLELWIIAWERRLLFSVLVLVITPCFGEVGWGGFGFHIWDGVIRECRVEKSNVPVLTHRFGRHKRGGLFCMGLSELWYTHSPWKDLTGVMLVSSLISLRLVVCFFGLGLVSWYSLLGVWENTSRVRYLAAYLFGVIRIGCCIFLYINNGYVADVSLGLGLFGFWVSRIFGKGLGSVWHDSAIFSLGWGYVRISSTGFWLCNIIYIIDKGFSMFGIDYGLSGYIASENCNEYDQLWFDYFGGDVCAAVKEFFYSSKLLGEFNANLISLVPKLQTPLKITDYRPIACCNVVYKCISKVITNRLKEGLGSIVDSNQSAFIPGRQISDNIFLAQEFMHGYGRKGGAQRCAFKVDIEKAYDTVDWDFLKIALQRFGFHSSMIKWIMSWKF
ncbi:RNA-directed DNA polymerase, eukaryota, reverse transcriptase zinc-binding domain protein, partial [Tanacetum coccineum]